MLRLIGIVLTFQFFSIWIVLAGPCFVQRAEYLEVLVSSVFLWGNPSGNHIEAILLRFVWGAGLCVAVLASLAPKLEADEL
jgi:hypothetical protein